MRDWNNTYIGKRSELLKLWLKSINAYLQSVAVLRSTYFLISSSDLDDICQWVTDKRSYFCGKQFLGDEFSCDTVTSRSGPGLNVC